MLEMAEKGQQHLGIIAVGRSDPIDLGEERCDFRFQRGNLWRDIWKNT
jgi:hypothetical protein